MQCLLADSLKAWVEPRGHACVMFPVYTSLTNLLLNMGGNYRGDGDAPPPNNLGGDGNANVSPRFTIVFSCYCVLFPFDCSLFFVAVCTDALFIDLAVAGI